jgi:phosphate transport system protein
MSLHLQREIDKLKKHLLTLCAMVEEQVAAAIKSLVDRDEAAAREVERRDAEIDHKEIEVEEDCLKTLALYQPVAVDLRLIVAAMKINNDLERIGDMAVNIARKAAALAIEPPLDVPCDIIGMWEKTQTMLRDSLNALVNADVKLAESVCARDDDIDRMKRANRLELEEKIRREPARVAPLLRMLAVSRNLERIADCAVNIAEDVIYLVEGKIIRHGEKD